MEGINDHTSIFSFFDHRLIEINLFDLNMKMWFTNRSCFDFNDFNLMAIVFASVNMVAL